MSTSRDDTGACRSFTDELPELALGVLTGRDRAQRAGPRRLVPALRGRARAPGADRRHGGAACARGRAPARIRRPPLRTDGCRPPAPTALRPARAALDARDRGGRGGRARGRTGTRALVGAVDVTAGECPAGRSGRPPGRLGRAGRRERNGRARRRLRRGEPVDVDGAGRLGRPRVGDVLGGHRHREARDRRAHSRPRRVTERGVPRCTSRRPGCGRPRSSTPAAR